MSRIIRPKYTQGKGEKAKNRLNIRREYKTRLIYKKSQIRPLILWRDGLNFSAQVRLRPNYLKECSGSNRASFGALLVARWIVAHLSCPPLPFILFSRQKAAQSPKTLMWTSIIPIFLNNCTAL